MWYQHWLLSASHLYPNSLSLESKNDWMTERPELEGAHKDPWVQLLGPLFCSFVFDSVKRSLVLLLSSASLTCKDAAAQHPLPLCLLARPYLTDRQHFLQSLLHFFTSAVCLQDLRLHIWLALLPDSSHCAPFNTNSSHGAALSLQDTLWVFMNTIPFS